MTWTTLGVQKMSVSHCFQGMPRGTWASFCEGSRIEKGCLGVDAFLGVCGVAGGT